MQDQEKKGQICLARAQMAMQRLLPVRPVTMGPLEKGIVRADRV
jgi:hypothetical protein